MGTMKIVEALKRLGHLVKKIEQNAAEMAEFAAQPAVEMPRLVTEEAMRAKIEGLRQSNRDLVEEELRLKSGIDYTNGATLVNICGFNRTINEHLHYKRKLAGKQEAALKGLRTAAAKCKTSIRATDKTDVRLSYDEEDVVNELRKLEEYLATIDGRLEVVNATTDVIWPPVQ